MADIIKLLPDSVANQIAAGEVIQRPASVIKELVENALDAGATKIQVNIKDAGRTLIQVIDNGCGMSPTDARLAFDRHATSKISDANDLFFIKTLGFRGEALASIAAISSLELKTKRIEDQIGTEIKISASKFESQEQTACNNGSNFMVKNLFFNIPARRKFLKTNQTEYRYIQNEIYRVALTNSNVEFHIIFDGKDYLVLKKENLKQRIINIFGKKLNTNLININTKTSIVTISGYVSKPERTKKNTGEQFFFVNNRYMQHPYFRKAVSLAYEKLIPEGEHPSYFIYFDIDPAKIDVNIHPTKTEIKFEDELAIFQILNACIKEALGKFNVLPSMDFNDDITRDAHFTNKTKVKPPTININHDYNPFKESSSNNFHHEKKKEQNTHKQLEDFYSNSFDAEKAIKNKDANKELFDTGENESNSNISDHKVSFYQFKKRFIITAGKNGMIVIDQSRAHERILYENFLIKLENRKSNTQKTMFPVELDLNNQEKAYLLEIIDVITAVGFEIELSKRNKVTITGMPGDLSDSNPEKIITKMINNLLHDFNEDKDIKMMLHERVACSLSKSAAMKNGIELKEEEMKNLFYRLMSCSNHNHTVDGKKILDLITIDEIEKKFK